MDVYRESKWKSNMQKLHRWITNPSMRLYEWQSTRSYWICLQYLQSVQFWFGKQNFGLKNRTLATKESASIFREIINLVFRQVILSIGLIIALEILERHIVGYASSKNAFLHHIASYMVVIRNAHMDDMAVCRDTAATLAQISGAFIGLYFAAISVVVSTIYANAPNDVRSVFIHDKVSSFYIRMIAFLGSISLVVLGANTLGINIGFLSLSLIILLGIVSILSFTILGTRIFQFFDPSELVVYIAQDFHKCTELATNRGLNWQDKSFQYSYQRKGDNLLVAYSNFSTLLISVKYTNGSTLLKLGKGLIALFVRYEKQKLRIPTTSKWFPDTNMHRNWLTADYLLINLAIASGTSLEPSIENDFLWVENRIYDMLDEIVDACLARSDVNNAALLGNEIQMHLNLLGEIYAVDEALDLSYKFSRYMDAIPHNIKSDDISHIDATSPVESSLAFVDVYGMGLSSILIGFSKKIESVNSNALRNIINTINWDHTSSLYDSGLPQVVVTAIGYLQRQLDFEHRVEGCRRTPEWYIEQIIAAEFIRFIARTLDNLISRLEIFFLDEATKLISANKHILASQIIVRGLESCRKFIAHLSIIRKPVEELNSFRVVEDVSWASIEWEKQHERISKAHKALVCIMAESVNELAALPEPGKLPDYFGYAYSVLADEVYNAMKTDDEELFNRIFPRFFDACLLTFDKLRKASIQDADTERLVTLGMEPLIDLLELSGYSALYSELDGRSYWSTALMKWDSYIMQLIDPLPVISLFQSAIDLSEGPAMKHPRSMIRIVWRQEFGRTLRERDLIHDADFYFRNQGKQIRSKHPSRIIQAFAGDRYLIYSATNIFIIKYSQEQSSAIKFELKGKAQDLAESLTLFDEIDDIGDNE